MLLKVCRENPSLAVKYKNTKKERKMAFHVTLKSNIESILKSGLVPQIGERSEILGELEPAVYLFRTFEECDNALWNWLGEEFEDLDEDLLILEVDVDKKHYQKDSNGDLFYEIEIKEVIKPEKILKIYEENYQEWKNN